MSQMFEVIYIREANPGEMVFSEACEKKLSDFEHEEITVDCCTYDFDAYTPNIFTNGVTINSSESHDSYSIKLRIDNTGNEKKAFLKMLRKVVKQCEHYIKIIRGDIPVKFLYEPKSLFEAGLNTYQSYYVFARVPKVCDLWEAKPTGLKSIKVTDLVDKKGSIRCVLRFRCIMISEKGATLIADLLRAIVEDLKDSKSTDH